MEMIFGFGQIYRWLKNRTLRQQFPQLFNHTTMPTARIAHMGDLNLFWKRHLRHSKLEQVNDHLLALLDGVKLKHHTVDSKRWESERNGEYTMKYCNIFFDRIEYPGMSSISSKILWKGKAPPKIEIFLRFLVLQGRICTREFLACRHVINLEQAICPLGANEIEYVEHLLFNVMTFANFGTVYELVRLRTVHEKDHRSSLARKECSGEFGWFFMTRYHIGI
jgi:hypothetical protein